MVSTAYQRNVSVRLIASAVLLASLVSTALAGAGTTARIVAENDRPVHSVENSGPEDAGSSHKADAAFQLDSKRQKVIWESEHIVFKFENYVAGPMNDALVRRDAEELRRFFLPNALVLAAPDLAKRERQAGPVHELQVASTVKPPATAEEPLPIKLIDSWIEEIAPITKIEGSRLRILFIRPEAIVDGQTLRDVDLLWVVRGRDAAGAPFEWQSEFSATFQYETPDAINRGRVLTEVRLGRSIVRRAPRPLMEEVTAAVGLDRVPIADNWDLKPDAALKYRFQFAVEDYDRDGFPDIAVAQIDGPPLLLHSDKGRSFTDVASKIGIKPKMPARGPMPADALATWIDFNNDGFPDLLLGRRFYRNLNGKLFAEATTESGLRFDRVPLGTNVADYDGDGWLDLYILYQKKFSTAGVKKRPWVGDLESGAENELWLNVDGKRFRRLPDSSGSGGGKRQSFAATTMYWDDDPFPDLYIANDFGKNVLLRGLGQGRFEDISDHAGAADFATSMGVASGDLDNDGQPEIYVANMYSKMGRRIIDQVGEEDYPPGVYEQIEGSCLGNTLYKTRSRGGTAQEWGHRLGIEAVGWAYAPALFDLDGDAWLDIYATTGFMSFKRDEPDG